MAQTYLGEIRLFAGNFAPQGWALCDGAVLSIAESAALFDLIGTTYGGDGQSTFALPDLRGRVPVHQGTNNGSYTIGQMGGEESVTLTAASLPAHAHPLSASTTAAATNSPSGNVPATTDVPIYSSGTAGATMSRGALATTGGSQPHTNIMPYGCVTYIIALFGVFPSQS